MMSIKVMILSSHISKKNSDRMLNIVINNKRDSESKVCPSMV